MKILKLFFVLFHSQKVKHVFSEPHFLSGSGCSFPPSFPLFQELLATSSLTITTTSHFPVLPLLLRTPAAGCEDGEGSLQHMFSFAGGGERRVLGPRNYPFFSNCAESAGRFLLIEAPRRRLDAWLVWWPLLHIQIKKAN